jgi:excisionase family DNA binding protein
MKRTRKWTFVAQEATRLAELGLTPREIAKRLDLAKSTVIRWIRAGKLPKTAPSKLGPPGETPGSDAGQTAANWATRVRRDYALDATDEQLVQLAELALTTARDPAISVRVRLSAMTRFQAIVKQLALVTRQKKDALPPAPPEPPKDPPKPLAAPRPRREDPRATLLVN